MIPTNGRHAFVLAWAMLAGCLGIAVGPAEDSPPGLSEPSGPQVCNNPPCVSTPATPITIPLTVHAVAGSGPANLVSNAIPFRPGVLLDPAQVRLVNAGGTEVPLGVRILARWPQDGSIRSLLLQFEASATGAHTLSSGVARTASDRALVPVTWDMPMRLATPSALYLSRSLIFWDQKPLGQTGFPAWDAKQQADYDAIDTVGTASCARDDHYYDAITTTFQMYARTGDPTYLANGRRWALHHRRDQIHLSGPNVGHGICPSGYLNNTRYTFPQGLAADYLMFGDDESLRVSALVVDNFYLTHPDSWYYKAPNTRGFWTEREAAFSMIGLVAHYEATGQATYLNTLQQRVGRLHQMQVDNGRRAWVHNLYDHDPSEGCPTTAYGSSPWMSGLLLEALVRYHKLTQDPLARESILMAVDDLQARAVATTGAFAGESFIYLGCPTVYSDGNPDLDNLVAHAFAYAYRLSGYTRNDYRDLGLALFNTAVDNGYSGAHKQFNQHFRSSGYFVADIDPAWGSAP